MADCNPICVGCSIFTGVFGLTYFLIWLITGLNSLDNNEVGLHYSSKRRHIPLVGFWRLADYGCSPGYFGHSTRIQTSFAYFILFVNPQGWKKRIDEDILYAEGTHFLGAWNHFIKFRRDKISVSMGNSSEVLDTRTKARCLNLISYYSGWDAD